MESSWSYSLILYYEIEYVLKADQKNLNGYTTLSIALNHGHKCGYRFLSNAEKFPLLQTFQSFFFCIHLSIVFYKWKTHLLVTPISFSSWHRRILPQMRLFCHKILLFFPVFIFLVQICSNPKSIKNGNLLQVINCQCTYTTRTQVQAQSTQTMKIVQYVFTVHSNQNALLRNRMDFHIGHMHGKRKTIEFLDFSVVAVAAADVIVVVVIV